MRERTGSGKWVRRGKALWWYSTSAGRIARLGPRQSLVQSEVRRVMGKLGAQIVRRIHARQYLGGNPDDASSIRPRLASQEAAGAPRPIGIQ